MSTISSKQARKHSLVDPMYVLVFLALILALLLLGPLSGNAYDSLSGALGALNGTSTAASAGAGLRVCRRAECPSRIQGRSRFGSPLRWRLRRKARL
jgi:hypothetical protein